MSNVSLTFHGGVDSVTGAMFLLEFQGKKALVDCGMVQGGNDVEAQNWEAFPFDPASIDVLFITHSHIDHIGRVGKLIHDGFQGKIISTPPTKALAEVMLRDALSVLSYKSRKDGKEPYFDEKDIDTAMRLWETCEYTERYQLTPDVSVSLRNAGHILGSAMYCFEGVHHSLLFSGDLGNGQGILTPSPDSFSDASYVVMESVYGDRLHEDPTGRKKRLEKIIERTVAQKGTLMIPAFSLERTQIMLYELNELVEGGSIPSVPVFLDSPLAIEVTEIYARFTDYFDKPVRDDIASGDDIFSFPNLEFTETRDDSKSINSVPSPKIIIAGAGMSHAGRIVFHEARYLEDSKNTLLIVGYQSPGSFGRRLLEGEKFVELLGDKIQVKAQIETLLNYSSHGDKNDLLSLVESGGEKLKQVFVAMGEDSSRTAFAESVRRFSGKKAAVPKPGQQITLEL